MYKCLCPNRCNSARFPGDEKLHILRVVYRKLNFVVPGSAFTEAIAQTWWTMGHATGNMAAM